MESMNRRAVAFAVLGAGFLLLVAEEILGSFHGGDMCWGGNGEPFNGQPCAKNFVADPLLMFFSNLWVRLTAFTAYSTWGIRLFDAMVLTTLIVSLAFFFLALRELDKDSKRSLVSEQADKSPAEETEPYRSL